MNDALYQVASFQVFRRATVWRWSHARHHTDTLVVGRDPEIAAPRPTDWLALASSIVALKQVSNELPKMFTAAFGRMNADDRTFVPASEWPKVFREARISLAIYVVVIGASVYFRTILPCSSSACRACTARGSICTSVSRSTRACPRMCSTIAGTAAR